MKCSPRPRRTRRSSWFAVPLVVACLSLTFVVAGCGGAGSNDTSGVTSTTAGTDATSPVDASSETMSGGDLGQAAAALWAGATQKLVILLGDEPASDDVKDEVAALKEEYVQKLVALGRQRESMDAAAKAEADSATTSALAAAANEDWYATYMDLYDHYSYASGDVDFVNLLASFNILTEYADFDLLKKQEPDEATRLGIQ